MVVLGIDPGSVIIGYGVVERQGSKCRLVASGCFRPGRDLSFSARLLEIHNSLLTLVEEVRPDEVALEDVFYGGNQKTLMKMCHARGAILLALEKAGHTVAEYAPREVKKAVVGQGGATKEQVQFMVGRILDLPEAGDPLDVTDAIAVALCHVNRAGLPARTEGGRTAFQEKLRAIGVEVDSRGRRIRG